MRYVIGIDEVGRGPLAGPVVVAAFAATTRSMKQEVRIKGREPIRLRDSKKLSAEQRETWLRELKRGEHGAWAIARVHPRRIEKINISKAANRAATNALCALMKRLGITKARVVLDGGLYLDPRRISAENFTVRAETIIRGDEKFSCVQFASIVAKVTRDRYMVRKHKEFPHYGFDDHKGYGTRAHIAALKQHGPSPLHRQTFIRSVLNEVGEIAK